MKDVDECGGPKKIDIYLKLENEQKCGTFKTRGAVNYVAGLDPEVLKQGIVTPSVGSFGQVGISVYCHVCWCRPSSTPCLWVHRAQSTLPVMTLGRAAEKSRYL